MTFRSAYFPGLLAILAAACGGSVFGQKDDPGAGGSSTSGSSSRAGSNSTAGKPSHGGSSASGGSASTGGSVGTAGSVGVAGSVSPGGGPNCEAVDCPLPVCPDSGRPIQLAGQCCPSCPPSLGCGGVTCTPAGACAMGSKFGQPPGACCEGCIPDPGAASSCPPIPCGDTACPLGYVRGDLVGGCCTSCLPDPLFCNDDSECVIADRPRPCCGCPEAINFRQYEADQCWSAIGAPRTIPQSCQPQVVCDRICNVCPAPGGVSCANHRCTEMIPMSNGPK